MKLYLINLPEAEARRRRELELLRAAGFEVEVVDAVRGAEVPPGDPRVDARAVRLCQGKRHSAGEVGNYLSHLRVLEKFLATGDDHAAVAEDDVLPAAGSRELVMRALEHADRWDILRLSGIHRGARFGCFPLDGGHRLAINLFRMTGTGAYVVNRRAAAVILERLGTMRMTFDQAFDMEWKIGLRAMMIDPLPFDQKAFEDGTSQVTPLPQKAYKSPWYIRYWTVFPFRAWTEGSRVAVRSIRLAVARLGRMLEPAKRGQVPSAG